MPLQQRITTAGLSAVNAAAIQGTTAPAVTASGTTQGTAPPITADINYVTAGGAGTGLILPAMNPGDSVNVYNKTGAALLIYPPVGAVINSLALNTAYNCASATPYVEVYCITPLIYIASQSA
jgi:hypothetical protein